MKKKSALPQKTMITFPHQNNLMQRHCHRTKKSMPCIFLSFPMLLEGYLISLIFICLLVLFFDFIFLSLSFIFLNTACLLKSRTAIKQSIFTILTRLLCYHPPYIIYQHRSFGYFMSLYNRMIMQVLAFLSPCILQWKWKSFKLIQNCRVYWCLSPYQV